MFKIVDETNIDEEHICCALSEKKNEPTMSLKKQWMKEQFANGLYFEKLDQRGKVFIEAIPAEYAFAPVCAPGYLYINCLWVSGKYKNKGYGDQLLDRLKAKAVTEGKKGLVVLSSKKKRHFLSDPEHLKHYGFKVADTWAPDFELLYYPLVEDKVPKFQMSSINGDHVLYYSHQCPHTEKYVKLVEETAEMQGISLEVRFVKDYITARNVPCPFTTYALFLDGNFVTTEVLTEKKFIQLLKKHMLI